MPAVVVASEEEENNVFAAYVNEVEAAAYASEGDDFEFGPVALVPFIGPEQLGHEALSCITGPPRGQPPPPQFHLHA